MHAYYFGRLCWTGQGPTDDLTNDSKSCINVAPLIHVHSKPVAMDESGCVPVPGMARGC